MVWYTRDNEQLILKVYIQPGAKHTELAGLHGEALKIRMQAPPIDGRANAALLKFIAQIFAVPARQVLLQRGDKSRHKTLIISGSHIDPAGLA